ncbi:response regulator [Virgibacillus dakarensis]|nr:response regulator [Virgibacillus dakarensis]
MKSRELCRAIIVDDELLIRQGIKHYIDWEAEGFQIAGEASNGQEALELIEVTNPHIILTDIVMPIMDGEELTSIVKSKYPHIEIIILSSFDEFDYVRSAFQSGVIDYILKPNLNADDLLQVLKKAANRIPSFSFSGQVFDTNLSLEHVIDKLISGYEDDYDESVPAKIFPHDNYYLLGLDLGNHPLKRENDFLQTMKERFSMLINAQIGHAAYHPFNVEQDIILFIINTEVKQRADIMKMANIMVESDLGVSIVLTKEFSNFSEVGYQYKENIVKLLQYRFYFPDQSVLLADDLPNEAANYESFNLDKFTDDFTHERFETAIKDLKDHAKILNSCYTMEIVEFKYFFENIIFTITILLGNMKYDVKVLEAKKYSYFQSIDEAICAAEVMEQLNLFIKDVRNSIALRSNALIGNSNMKKLLEYIQEHYAEALTLTSVANHFHFSPSYLSSYFRAHNKEGFIEYLNRIRIEEATKLLEQNTLTISEISAMVGYSDHSYFCKVFKKIIGVSPSKYRKKSIKVKTGL